VWCDRAVFKICLGSVWIKLEYVRVSKNGERRWELRWSREFREEEEMSLRT